MLTKETVRMLSAEAKRLEKEVDDLEAQAAKRREQATKVREIIGPARPARATRKKRGGQRRRPKRAKVKPKTRSGPTTLEIVRTALKRRGPMTTGELMELKRVSEKVASKKSLYTTLIVAEKKSLIARTEAGEWMFTEEQDGE